MNDNQLHKILKKKSIKIDHNGIAILKSNKKINEETKISKERWEKIYNYNLKELIKDRKNFDKYKLQDHLRYIGNTYDFNKDTNYLEIGCGPAHIAEYLIKKYNVNFIGVDFNYEMLLTLKKYFDKKGYKKYLLIHGYIDNMPIKDKTIDVIYGGGVIEHTPNTSSTLNELYRVLKDNGASLNTVPAFNLFWLTRFFYSIPNVPFLRKIAEYIHLNKLNGSVLEKYYGYELSFTKKHLYNLHKKAGFVKINISNFYFHASKDALKNKFLRNIYFKITKNKYFSPFHFIVAKKSIN